MDPIRRVVHAYPRSVIYIVIMVTVIAALQVYELVFR